jgi:NADPH:quinone reductase-like Zn-dependent oxidoreductase
MRAVRINQVSDDLSGIELVEVPLPDPGPGQLRIRMVKVAI